MGLFLQFIGILAITMVIGGWYWVWRFFGALNLSTIVFTLTLGARTSLEANQQMWRGFRNAVIRRPLAIAAVVTALIWLVSEGAAQGRLRAMLAAVGQSPLIVAGAAAVLLLAAAATLLRGDIAARWRHRGRASATGYVDGRHVVVRPTRPRNLIVIQMESLEGTFGRADIVGRDALAPLKALEGFSFERLTPSPGAGWTTSSMMTTLFGVPFVAPLAFARAYRGRGAVAPSACGLGDLLQRQGYRGVAMQGAVSGFHGFADLFSQHGFSRVLGSEHLLPRGVSAVSSWGVYDDDLFDFALDEVERLRAAGGLHCLYIATSDTHSPRGDVSPRLRQRLARPTMLDVVGYSAEMAARFVRVLGERGYLADTRVAIIGDHLMPPIAAVPQLMHAGERTIFNRFIATDAPPPVRTEIAQTDLAATLFEFAGFATADGRLGLGRSAFRAETADAPAPPLTPLAEFWRDRSAAGDGTSALDACGQPR